MIDQASPLRRLYCDRRGVAGIEFGLIAPVMLLMLFATFELFNATRVQAKLNLAAGQLAQMIAAQTSVTEGSNRGSGGTLGDLCTAVSYNMLPYDPSQLSGWIESTTVNAGKGTGQDWANDVSCPSTDNQQGSFNETIALTRISDTPRSMFTSDGTPKAGGKAVPGYSAITVQLTYKYSNLLPYLLGPVLTFTAVGSARPRLNITIPCTYPNGAATASCTGVY